MARDVMTVRLHLAQTRVLEVVEDTPGALVVSVESTFRRLRCAQCGFKCRRVHDRRAKRVRDLEVSGRRMTLVWQRRRMVCSNCASRFLEDHPAFEGALTARLSHPPPRPAHQRRRRTLVRVAEIRAPLPRGHPQRHRPRRTRRRLH